MPPSSPTWPRTATDQFIARYSGELSADDVTTLRDVAAALLEWQLSHPEPFSLIHGDYRLDNLMLHPTRDDVVAVDWQTVTVALPARDLGYFIGTSLPTGQRRAEEERLLVDVLRGASLLWCARNYSSERCLADYRLGQLHGPNDYRDRVPDLRRIAQPRWGRNVPVHGPTFVYGGSGPPIDQRPVEHQCPPSTIAGASKTHDF